MMFAKLFLPCFALVALLGLGACNSGTRGVTSGASVSPTSTGVTNIEACIQSCDGSHARCMDAGSARRDVNDVASTIYGTKFDCEAELRSCLPKCKGR
jgi:hypothetical protein